jgi:hypothetical protein
LVLDNEVNPLTGDDPALVGDIVLDLPLEPYPP